MKPQAAFLLGLGVMGLVWAATAWLGGGPAPKPLPRPDADPPQPWRPGTPSELPPAALCEEPSPARNEAGRAEVTVETTADAEEVSAPEEDEVPTVEAVLARLAPATRAQLDQVDGSLAHAFAFEIARIGVWVDDETVQHSGPGLPRMDGGLLGEGGRRVEGGAEEAAR